MEVLLLDIAETLEARDVRLPGGKAVVSMAGHVSGEEEGDEDMRGGVKEVEVSDLEDDDDEDDWSYDGEKGDQVSALREVPGAEGFRRVSKRLSTVKREQRLGQHGEVGGLDEQMDRMNL